MHAMHAKAEAAAHHSNSYQGTLPRCHDGTLTRRHAHTPTF